MNEPAAKGLLITGIMVLVFGIIGYIVTDDFIRENRLPVAIGQFGCQSVVGEMARSFSTDINQTCQNLGFIVGLVSASLIICPILIVIGPIMAIVGCLQILKLRKANAEENTLEVLGTSNKQILMGQIKWVGIGLAISLGISFVVPFPFSLPVMIGVFIWLGFYMTKRAMRKVGMSGAPLFGGNSSLLNYYCMSCGKKHNKAACPKCGSKMKRVGS